VPAPDVHSALDITARLVAVGTSISAFEHLAGLHHFGAQGIFGARSLSPLHRHPALLLLLDRCLVAILSLQAIGSLAVVVFGPFLLVGRVAVLLSLASLLAIRYRRYAGGDGAEQFAVLTLAATALATLPVPSEARVKLAVIFVAAELALAYVTSGVAKLLSPVWRSGTALPLILNTSGHGHPWAVAFLRRHGRFALVSAWAVILFECASPALALGPPWLLMSTLAVGVSFHLCCAVFMGLNSFLWSFPASYPVAVAAIALLPPHW
jgi:hypothetical protein